MYNAKNLSFTTLAAAVGLFVFKKSKENGFLKNHSDMKNFTAGGVAGFIAGNIVGPIEAIKVKQQISSGNIGVIKILKKDWRSLLGVAPFFGMIFGSVCALEFSVNDNLGKQYGKGTGVVASAMTGSAFLTAADHLMFRMDKGQSAYISLKHFYSTKPLTLWTGFSPMFFREAIAIINVMIIGPMLGNILKKASGLENDSSKDDLFWNTLGRYPATLVGTVISHPFDVVARELQKELYAAPSHTRKITELVANTNLNQYRKGLAPRMMLAPIGLTIAGSGFDFFRNKLDTMNSNVPIQESQELPVLSMKR